MKKNTTTTYPPEEVGYYVWYEHIMPLHHSVAEYFAKLLVTLGCQNDREKTRRITEEFIFLSSLSEFYFYENVADHLIGILIREAGSHANEINPEEVRFIADNWTLGFTSSNDLSPKDKLRTGVVRPLMKAQSLAKISSMPESGPS